jgi:hypothetical protein
MMSLRCISGIGVIMSCFDGIPETVQSAIGLMKEGIIGGIISAAIGATVASIIGLLWGDWRFDIVLLFLQVIVLSAITILDYIEMTESFLYLAGFLLVSLLLSEWFAILIALIALAVILIDLLRLRYHSICDIGQDEQSD